MNHTPTHLNLHHVRIMFLSFNVRYEAAKRCSVKTIFGIHRRQLTNKLLDPPCASTLKVE